MKSKAKMTGTLETFQWGPAGKLIDHSLVDNLVITTGREHMIDLLGPQLQAPMSHMAMGDGTTGADLGDTALEGTELGRIALTSITPGTGTESNKITYVCDFAPGESSGACSEAAIFNAAVDGNMLCRTVFDVKNKGAGDTIRQIWIITITS